MSIDRITTEIVLSLMIKAKLFLERDKNINSGEIGTRCVTQLGIKWKAAALLIFKQID